MPKRTKGRVTIGSIQCPECKSIVDIDNARSPLVIAEHPAAGVGNCITSGHPVTKYSQCIVTPLDEGQETIQAA